MGKQMIIVGIECGHEWNERCDQLATAAADDTTNSIRDEVYEKSASNY